MKKKLLMVVALLVVLVAVSFAALPAFAQTKLATLIPGQPLTLMAAHQIISDSGLPIEMLPGGITGSLTKGRDAVNAYRYAHGQLGKSGWYRGISEDHTPLLVAMVEEMEREGFTSNKSVFENKKNEILQKFWYDSDAQNARELGYDSVAELQTALANMEKTGKQVSAGLLRSAIDSKWK